MTAPDFNPQHGRLLTRAEFAKIPFSLQVVESPDGHVARIAQIIVDPETSRRLHATCAAWFSHKESQEDWLGIREALVPFTADRPDLLGVPVVCAVTAMLDDLTAALVEIADLKAKLARCQKPE